MAGNPNAPLGLSEFQEYRRPMDPIQKAIDKQLETPPLEITEGRKRPENIVVKMCDEMRQQPVKKTRRRRRRRRIRVQVYNQV